MERELSRRQFVKLAGVAGAISLTANGLVADEPRESPGDKPGKLGPEGALRELLSGNERFVSGRTTAPRRDPAYFKGLAAGQNPIAAIVSCADSRVSPEILFDVGKGDIFVVRVAGNVVGGAGPIVKGSIEYAVAELGVQLLMVLGHSNCGAVKAAISHIDAKDSLPGAINGLVELIKPAVAQSRTDKGVSLENAIRQNVLVGVDRLKSLEPIIAPKVKEGSVMVVGGVYDLNTGKVGLVS